VQPAGAELDLQPLPMNNEPLEREPIDPIRARLEAL